MSAPVMSYQHALDFLKGWFQPAALDFTALKSANATATMYNGRVVHVNSAGQFELGAQLTQMPIFLKSGESDFDVANPGGTNWYAVAPIGYLTGLVATGSYELSTTEFDQTPGVVYAAGDVLHAPTESQITGTDKSTAGLLFRAKTWPGGGGGALASGVDNICAVVSRGASINHWKQAVLTFWPVYRPGTV